MRPIRQGAVYFVPGVPALDDEGSKPRPCIVISTKEQIAAGEIILIGATTTPQRAHADVIHLTSRAHLPSASLYLTRETFAITRWVIAAKAEHLRDIDYRGHVTARELAIIIVGSRSYPCKITLPDSAAR